MQTCNWHTHTFRCKHASGDVPDYCRAAVAAGLSTLGFSDHMPTPDGRWGEHRMSAADLPGYAAAVAAARPLFPELSLFAGMECDFVPGWETWYDDELRGRAGLQYLALAVHAAPVAPDDWRFVFGHRPAGDPALLRGFAETVLAGIASGRFLFVAHPDVYGTFFDAWTPDAEAVARDVCQAARDAGMPLEINTYGIRKGLRPDADGTLRWAYPWEPFWRVAAEEGALAVVNSDAHSPELVAETFAEAEALAARTGVRILRPASPGDFPSFRPAR